MEWGKGCEMCLGGADSDLCSEEGLARRVLLPAAMFQGRANHEVQTVN